MILEGLIKCGKVKTRGGMVFLPRKKIGVEKTWGRNDTASRSKDLRTEEWDELEDSLAALTAATKDDMFTQDAESASSSGTSTIDIGSAGRPVACKVFGVAFAQREQNKDMYLKHKDDLNKYCIELERALKLTTKVVEQTLEETNVAERIA